MVYLSDDEIGGSARNLVVFVAWVFLVPIFRDFHFYGAHRLLHFKFLYKYAHSTHHRNTDVEPFAGLAMHPVEHMYYFSCVAPLL
jgi:sterol desaturase/sphingolipid hydroxylase (fatty acid hydroxylase superfamily)